FDVYILIWSFYRLFVYRHLHSFPTRRSSDLVDAVGPVQVHPAVRGDDARIRLGLQDVEDAAGGLDAHVVYLEHHVALHHAAHGVDRKSTRLNSSHVKISYAVFCLKKKKIK